MKTIESFLVDHTVLTAGIYLSRVDGDAVTYDLRLKRPNVEKVLDNAP
ncbi:MAG: S-ribosylhomocysteine lyase, partial [Clostridia bacterium]|nr:S-ribosylhomocysteine lyase [Clostridia bacterium]